MIITKEGIAVVEGDMLLSKDVEEAGRLDVAHRLVDLMKPYIPTGGVVVDVGACIGDHTITYSDWVGPTGKVYAFEPNPVAYECLRFNMESRKNVIVIPGALGAGWGRGTMKLDTYNIGASQVIYGTGKVEIFPLDTFALSRLDFIKIDAEGMEPWILDGAKDTLKRCRPVMLIEINADMLGRLGSTTEDVYQRIRSSGYTTGVFDGHNSDLVCIPS